MKASKFAMKRPLVIVAIVAAVLVLIVGMAVGSYNKLVRLDEGVEAQWAQVETAYQRRADLIPNLVSTVKGAAAHERETLQAVTEARARVGSIDVSRAFEDPEAFQRFQEAQAELSSALSRLIAVAEAYPNLRVNENFLALQSQIEGSENRIAVERQRYNEAAREFNTTRSSFPTVLFASMFSRFETKMYFESEPGSSRAPEVTFDE
jgi:LemA protein